MLSAVADADRAGLSMTRHTVQPWRPATGAILAVTTLAAPSVEMWIAAHLVATVSVQRLCVETRRYVTNVTGMIVCVLADVCAAPRCCGVMHDTGHTKSQAHRRDTAWVSCNAARVWLKPF